MSGLFIRQMFAPSWVFGYSQQLKGAPMARGSLFLSPLVWTGSARRRAWHALSALTARRLQDVATVGERRRHPSKDKGAPAWSGWMRGVLIDSPREWRVVWADVHSGRAI